MSTVPGVNRDELIEAMVRAVEESGGCIDGASAVLDAVEPLIRADERAVMRAKVKAEPAWIADNDNVYVFIKDTVLDLFDEA